MVSGGVDYSPKLYQSGGLVRGCGYPSSDFFLLPILYEQKQ